MLGLRFQGVSSGWHRSIVTKYKQILSSAKYRKVGGNGDVGQHDRSLLQVTNKSTRFRSRSFFISFFKSQVSASVQNQTSNWFKLKYEHGNHDLRNLMKITNK